MADGGFAIGKQIAAGHALRIRPRSDDGEKPVWHSPRSASRLYFVKITEMSHISTNARQMPDIPLAAMADRPCLENFIMRINRFRNICSGIARARRRRYQQLDVAAGRSFVACVFPVGCRPPRSHCFRRLNPGHHIYIVHAIIRRQ
jgi:hypothetical protein